MGISLATAVKETNNLIEIWQSDVGSDKIEIVTNRSRRVAVGGDAFYARVKGKRGKLALQIIVVKTPYGPRGEIEAFGGGSESFQLDSYSALNDFLESAQDHLVRWSAKSNPLKRRKNTIPRVKALRDKYRKRHGDEWWADPSIKEEYIQEKKELSRKAAGTKSTATRRKGKSTKKSRSKESSYDIMKRGVDTGHVSEDWLHVPNNVQEAFFAIQNKLEQLPDRFFNDGLYYNHVFITDGVALHIDTKHGFKKTRDLLQVLFLNYNTIQILAVKSGVTKKYKLSSTTAAFNYIKKWIESNLRKKGN